MKRLLEHCVTALDDLIYAGPGMHRVDGEDQTYEWAWEVLSAEAQEELAKARRAARTMLNQLNRRLDALD